MFFSSQEKYQPNLSQMKTTTHVDMTFHNLFETNFVCYDTQNQLNQYLLDVILILHERGKS